MKNGIARNSMRWQMLGCGIAVAIFIAIMYIRRSQEANNNASASTVAWHWDSVKEGMTKEDVTRLLGKPMRIQEYPKEGMSQWWYTRPVEDIGTGVQPGGGSIVFQGGEVVKVHTTDVIIERIRN